VNQAVQVLKHVSDTLRLDESKRTDAGNVVRTRAAPKWEESPRPCANSPARISAPGGLVSGGDDLKRRAVARKLHPELRCLGAGADLGPGGLRQAGGAQSVVTLLLADH